jgi:hypothetical protein
LLSHSFDNSYRPLLCYTQIFKIVSSKECRVKYLQSRKRVRIWSTMLQVVSRLVSNFVFSEFLSVSYFLCIFNYFNSVTGRAGCRGCRSTIAQGELRLAILVKVRKIEGKRKLKGTCIIIEHILWTMWVNVGFSNYSQSKYHDGKDPNWFHHKCFFAKHRNVHEREIQDFDELLFEDQQLIRKYLGKLRS